MKPRAHQKTLKWDLFAEKWHLEVHHSERFLRGRSETISVVFRSGAASGVELGCGSGFLTTELSGCCNELIAIDSSFSMVAIARDELIRSGIDHVDLRVDDVTLLGTESFASVDVVVASHLMGFLSGSERHRLSKNMLSWLRPGGCVVIADQTSNRRRPRRRIRPPFLPIGRLSARRMVCLFEREGYWGARVDWESDGAFVMSAFRPSSQGCEAIAGQEPADCQQNQREN